MLWLTAMLIFLAATTGAEVVSANLIHYLIRIKFVVIIQAYNEKTAPEGAVSKLTCSSKENL